MSLAVKVAVNPCTPTLSTPTLSVSGFLGSIEGAVAGEVSTLVSGVQGELGVLEGTAAGAVGSIVGQLNLLSLNLKSVLSLPSLSLGGFGLSANLGKSLLSGALGAVEGLASNLLNQVEQEAVSQATSLINGAVAQAFNAINNLAIGELQKDIGPLLNALQAINGVLGAVEAEKALVSAALSSATSCPARAELLAEAFFKG
jgi:hypothetical protein